MHGKAGSFFQKPPPIFSIAAGNFWNHYIAALHPAPNDFVNLIHNFPPLYFTFKIINKSKNNHFYQNNRLQILIDKSHRLHQTILLIFFYKHIFTLTWYYISKVIINQLNCNIKSDCPVDWNIKSNGHTNNCFVSLDFIFSPWMPLYQLLHHGCRSFTFVQDDA